LLTPGICNIISRPDRRTIIMCRSTRRNFRAAFPELANCGRQRLADLDRCQALERRYK
jgi:hypothetical protein